MFPDWDSKPGHPRDILNPLTSPSSEQERIKKKCERSEKKRKKCERSSREEKKEVNLKCLTILYYAVLDDAFGDVGGDPSSIV